MGDRMNTDTHQTTVFSGSCTHSPTRDRHHSRRSTNKPEILTAAIKPLTLATATSQTPRITPAS